MRKSSFFPRLALVNLLRNGQYYGPYLLACGGTAAMFYILRYLTESDIVSSVRGAGYLQSLMYLGCIVVALFSIVLLLYANSFVMKRRQRELGLYNILGLEKRHIALLCLWETLYCALAAIVGGIAVGILFSKLTLLLLLQIARLPVEFGFEISVPGIFATAALFAVLFALTLVCNLFRVSRSRPVELLHSDSAGEREPKTKRLLVVLGLLTLGGGYFLSWKVQRPEEALALFFLAVVLVMIGTYCLFTAGSVAVLKALRSNPGYYYQTRHFTAVAGLLHRMKQNAVGLANICILSTMVLVTVSTTVSLYTGMESSLDQMFPHDVDIIQSLDDRDEDGPQLSTEELLAQVERNLAAAGRKAELLQWYTRTDTVGYYSGNTFSLNFQDGINTQIELLTAEEYSRLTGRSVTLEPDQVFVQMENLDLPKTFYIESLPFHVAGTVTDFPRYNTTVLVSGHTARVSLVVADETVISAIGAQDRNGLDREFRIQMDLDGTEAQKLACVDLLLNGTGGGTAINSRQDNAVDLYAMYGGFLFLGIFLGLLFLLATALIIYYKQISEGYEDQRRYQILRQVGMTDREVRASIHSQILLVFFLPLCTAGIHTAAAYPMVSKLLTLFQLTSTGHYALCTAGTLAVFCAVYALVYGLTARAYRRIIA
ncbi:FtsX-like permease family protein [Dysosmobacter sp.]|uniref:FtsX-like permease family protein n=1 Tax=Dysosmobacter sp. TaxID=2591382 RepID=UPI003A959859